MKERELGWRETKKSRTVQKFIQRQLTWTHGGSQRLRYQPKTMQGLDLGPLHIYNRCTACFHMSPLRIREEAFASLLLILDPLPKGGLPCLTLVVEDVCAVIEGASSGYYFMIFFIFNFNFYWVFYLFTYQMLFHSQLPLCKPPILSLPLPCFYEGALPPIHCVLPHHSFIP